MSKLYFGKKKKWEPKLTVIISVVVVLFALLLIGPYLYSRSRSVLPSLGTVPAQDIQAQLQEAQGLFDQGAVEEAEKKLKPLLGGRDPLLTPRAVMLQAAIENGRNNGEAALQLLSKACDDFQGSPEFPSLAALKARQLEGMERFDEARGIYESVRDNAPPELRAMGLAGLGRLAEKAGDKQAARDLYRDAADNAPWGSDLWNGVVEDLGRLNVELIFSPEETAESRYYSVESGDSLISIGMKLNTTQGLLMTANSITDPAKLHLGQRLKYTPKDFRIVIERSTCNLYLLDNRGLFKRYKVGLGKPGHETTLGNYVLGNKQKDPVWFKPGAGPIEAGAEDNELGTRWMPMMPAREGLPTDLGIHGTIAPDTVGQYSSKGCARMKNEDVEELFDLVVRSTPVDVVDVYAPNSEGENSDTPDTPLSPAAPETADTPVSPAAPETADTPVSPAVPESVGASAPPSLPNPPDPPADEG